MEIAEVEERQRSVAMVASKLAEQLTTDFGNAWNIALSLKSVEGARPRMNPLARKVASN